MIKIFVSIVSMKHKLGLSEISVRSVCFLLIWFSAKEVTSSFEKLNNSALGLDGLSKAIFAPILFLVAPVVASFLTALLRSSVAPRHWQIAILTVIKKKGSSRKDLDNFRAVHIMNFLYKWYTQCLHARILPFALSRIPQQQGGFIEGGSCGQALLGLLTLISRSLRERGNHPGVFACFVDIRKAFPRVRRELLRFKIHSLGIPLIYIISVMALHEDFKAMVRDSDGGPCSLFHRTQGTREGCILSPLLFIIFFSDAVEAMENVQLDNGSIKLGSLLIPQA